MRLAADDVTRSLHASWRLLMADAKALPDLDLSRDGFWRSYLALILAVPAMIPILAAERTLAGLSNTGGLFDEPGLLAAVMTAELLAIVAVPALLAALAPALLHSPRFTGFIIAWNWAGIVSAGLMAVPAGVFALATTSRSGSRKPLSLSPMELSWPRRLSPAAAMSTTVLARSCTVPPPGTGA